MTIILYFLHSLIDLTYIRRLLFIQAFFRDRSTHPSKIKPLYRVQKLFT